MEPGMGTYVTFLVVGVILVFIDGRIIWRSGATYLEEVYPDKKVADSVNRLVAALFHLTVLGVVALISTMDVQYETAIETVVVRLGVLLLILAAAHGITIWVLARLRHRQRQQRLQEEFVVRSEDRLGSRTNEDDVDDFPQQTNP